MTENTAAVTYASAGVDVEAGDRAVELMKDAIRATHSPAVVGGVGGFAGLYDEVPPPVLGNLHGRGGHEGRYCAGA